METANRDLSDFDRGSCADGNRSTTRLFLANRKAVVTRITNCDGQNRMYNMQSLWVDGLQQQKTKPGSSSVIQEQKAKAVLVTSLSKLDSL